MEIVMKRKLLSIVIISIVCLSFLSACGKKTEELQNEPEPAAAVQVPEEEQKEEKKEEEPPRIPSVDPEPEQLEPYVKSETDGEEVPEGFVNSNQSVNYRYVDYSDVVTADDGFKVFEYTEVMPEFYISGNPEATKNLNDFLALMIASQHDDCDSLSAEALSDYKEYGNEIENYPSGYMGNSCTIERADDRIISIIITYYVYYPGAAHPNTADTCFNFSTRTGEVLVNDEIFDDPAAVSSLMTEKIDYEATSGEYKDMLYEDYKDLIENIFSDNNWYFDDNGITLIVNPYDLAPYAAGRLLFSLSYEDLSGNLKDDYAFVSP